jgi:polyisoprenoid-binding protein YceI
MNNLIKRAILLVAFISTLLSADDFRIDKGHSHVNFKIKHMMISNVTGGFGDYSGTVSFDSAKKSFTKFIGEVDAKSIDTGIKKRDDHLRSADFFDADKFAKIKFIMTEYKKVSEDEGKMIGTLTIRDVSKKVTLNVEIGGMITDPWGNTRLGVSMTSSINRKDFGLHWNKLLEGGGLVVGDKVKLLVDLELIKK